MNVPRSLRLAAPSLAALSLIVALAVPAASASAQDASFAEPAPASRPLYVGGGLGVSAGFNGSALFKLQEEIGYQLDPIYLGTVDLVMRVGGDFAQGFGDFTLLQFGARFTASFGVWRNEDLAVRIAPSLMLGGAVFITPQYCGAVCIGGDFGTFNIQFATQAELELLEGLLTIWFRPIGIDGFIADGSSGRWDILAGVDVHI